MKISILGGSFFEVSGGETMALLPLCVMIVLLMSFMPYLTRKSELFGISIPISEAEHPAIIALRRRYRNFGLLLGMVCIGIIWGLFSSANDYKLLGLVIILQLVAYFCLYLVFHNRAKAFKAAQNWEELVNSTIAVDLSSDSRQLTSPLWMLLYPVIILITAWLGWMWYPAAPDRLVHKWDFSGNALGWIDKSYGILIFLLVMQILMSALMVAIFYITKNARRQIDPDHMEESRRQLNTFRKCWSWFIILVGVAMNLIFTIALAAMFEVIPIGSVLIVLPIFFVVTLLITLWLTIKVGQGGSRIKIAKSGGGYISVREDDKYWKLGTIYYNPNDPAVFVEKRFGIGWTCNFARPLSWICLIGLLVFILLMVWVSNVLFS